MSLSFYFDVGDAGDYTCLHFLKSCCFILNNPILKFSTTAEITTATVIMHKGPNAALKAALAWRQIYSYFCFRLITLCMDKL